MTPTISEGLIYHFVHTPATLGSFNVSHVIDAISRKDYASILESPELFWLAFCSVYANKSDCFSAVLEGSSITIAGRLRIIAQIKKTIEEFRVYCWNGCKERKNISLSVVKIADNNYIRETQEVINLENWLAPSCPRIDQTWFLEAILPFLGDLCKLIGGELTQSRKLQKVRGDDCIGDRECLILDIRWATSEHFVHPIAPLSIPSRIEYSKAAYEFYRTQTLCDLTLAGSDGEIHAHIFPMLLHGGECIKAMLTSPMKEGSTKKIEFSDFTVDVLKTYVDFVYLGEEALKPEAFFTSGVNVFELLRFAHTYGIKPLVDSCTNLISLIAKAEDVERLRELAIYYENTHLARLCDYLSPSSSMMAFPKV